MSYHDEYKLFRQCTWTLNFTLYSELYSNCERNIDLIFFMEKSNKGWRMISL